MYKKQEFYHGSAYAVELSIVLQFSFFYYLIISKS